MIIITIISDPGTLTLNPKPSCQRSGGSKSRSRTLTEGARLAPSG